MSKLTEKQLVFCSEYLIDLNATQAAIRAGYSAKTASVIASNLLTNVKIRAIIDKEMADRSKRTGFNQDRVLRELARIAFVNPVEVVNMEDATVKEGSTADDTAAILSVKVKKIPTEYGTIVEREVKFNDKQKALEMLGRHLGMFNDKLEISGHTIIFEGENDLKN